MRLQTLISLGQERSRKAAVVVLFYPHPIPPCFTATPAVGYGRGRKAKKNLVRGVPRSKGGEMGITPVSRDSGRRGGAEK